MDEYIEMLFSWPSFSAVGDRSWLEIASILTPSVLVIFGIFLTSLFLKRKFLRKTIHLFCLVLCLTFLPYELFRQATEMSKADANISATQADLKKFLNASSSRHMELLTNKDVASKTLETLLFEMSKEQKQALLMVSWLIADNEVKARLHHDDKYQLLSDDIRLNLDLLKEEIIDSRTPVEKISDDILRGIERDVTQLIEDKMDIFNENIDASLTRLQDNVNTFVHAQLQEYDDALSLISQGNVEELRQHAEQARITFAQQINESNQRSLRKLDDTRKSVDNVGKVIAKANFADIATDVNQLSHSIEDIQRRNEVLFAYHECLRTVGFIDLAGKEAQCQAELNEALGKAEESDAEMDETEIGETENDETETGKIETE